MTPQEDIRSIYNYAETNLQHDTQWPFSL